MAENKITWIERTPNYSSTIFKHYITVDNEVVCNEKVEKWGKDSEGNWTELWGTQFEDGVITEYASKFGQLVET
jgi:hypothetical protein